MEERDLHRLLSYVLLIASFPTYVVTRYIVVAPFGKHASVNNTPWWHGPKFDARFSWFVFECPNLAWTVWCYARRDDLNVATAEEGGATIRISTNILLLALFAAHYVNRAVIYPLMMSPRSQPVPLVVSLSAGLFTSLNGYLQARYLCSFHRFLPLEEYAVANPQMIFGIALFFAGFLLNVHSDGILRNLRRRNNDGKDDGNIIANFCGNKNHPQQGQTQHRYYVPRGGMFEYCSCPNLLGEIIEWIGFSVASGLSLPSVAFVAYTASNLVPRALSHHEWYRSKFKDYPRGRTAIIPFLL